MYVQSSKENYWVAEVENLSSTSYKYRICSHYGEKFKKNGQFSTSIIGELLPATNEQIAHLKTCIAANKFLPYAEEMLKPSYEIY